MRINCLLIIILTTLYSITANAELNLLVLSDLHLNIHQRNSMQIDPKKLSKANDMDLISFKKLSHILAYNIKTGKLIKHPDFILLLGDLVGHIDKSLPPTTRASFVSADQKTVFSRLLQEYYPDTPIFYVFGNNDAMNINYGKFTDAKQNTAYAVAQQAGFKNGFLSNGNLCGNQEEAYPCLKQFDTNYGFYSAKLAPKIKLVVLNTVMYSPRHEQGQPAAAKQFKFLSNELQDSQTHHVATLIAMHIPVGYNIYDATKFWQDQYQKQFLTFINKYASVIKGILASHTHNDELKIIKTQAGLVGEYFTAGLSTSHLNAPSVKLFTLKQNNNSCAITNYTAYVFSKNNHKIHFSKAYDFKSSYCPKATNDISSCLNNVSINKIKQHYSLNPNAGNPILKAPQDIYIDATHYPVRWATPTDRSCTHSNSLSANTRMASTKKGNKST